MYPEAGTDAPPEVAEAVSRFRGLPDEERERIPLLYWILGSGTPPYKMAKDDARYTDRSADTDTVCANCEYMYTKTATVVDPDSEPLHICSQVTGSVRPMGWCRLWEAEGSVE